MKNIKHILSILSATFLSQLMFSQPQIGPGGVGNASTIAVWLDASQLGLNDGDPVATWTDVSGNGNSFTQGVGGNQPIFESVGTINSRPAVSFDGNDYLNSGAIAALSSDEVTWFTVTKVNSHTNYAVGERGTVLEFVNDANSVRLRQYYQKDNSTNSRMIGFGRNASDNLAFVSNIFSSNPGLQLPYITSFQWKASNELVNTLNGTSSTNSTIDGLMGNHLFTNLGTTRTIDQFFIGRIGDVIIFNEEINSAQLKIVQSYLSAKYNISVGTLNRYSNASTHAEDLAGIGRDDVSNQHLNAKGTGIIEISAASLDNNDYLLWAHDNGVLTSQTSNIPAGYVTTTGEAMTRTWRVTETGETGDLTFVVDMTGIQFGHPDDYQLLIDNDGDFTNGGTTQIDGVLVLDELTFTVSGAQLSDGNYFTIGNSNESVIRSIATGDWGLATTWSCTCVPGATNEFVTIVNGHTVTVSNGQAILDLTVQPTGVLAISSTGVLNVNGDLTIDGTINSDVEGTLNFIGLSAQTITATGTKEIGGLTLNNANGLTLVSGIYNFNGIFTPTNGNMDFGGNDINFVSNASGTAVIGVIGAGASFSGMSNFKVQRFIPTGDAGFRDIGSPLTAMPLSEWDDDIFISGAGFPDGCALTATGCYHSATYWDASLQAYRTVNDIDSNIMNGSALEIYLGDNLNSFAGRALTATGTPNTAMSVDIPVQNGWNLISNPFLSPIDFDDIARNSLNTGNYVYVYDHSINGFHYWDGAFQTASTIGILEDGILSSSQGFWVFHNGSPSTLTINQGSKSVNAADQFLRSNGVFSPQNNLYFELSSPSGNQKAIGSVKMYDAWKSNEVSNLPLLSLPNLKTASIYTTDENGNEYVVNNVNKEEDCFSMPVFVDVLRTGDYSVDFKNPGTEFDVFVKNNITGELTRLTQDMKFDFRVDGATKKVNPFNLEFKKVNPCIVDGITNDLFNVFASFDNIMISTAEPIEQDVTISVINTLGGQVIQNVRMNKESSNITINANGLSGLYLVSIRDLNGQVVKVEKVFINSNY